MYFNVTAVFLASLYTKLDVPKFVLHLWCGATCLVAFEWLTSNEVVTSITYCYFWHRGQVIFLWLWFFICILKLGSLCGNTQEEFSYIYWFQSWKEVCEYEVWMPNKMGFVPISSYVYRQKVSLSEQSIDAENMPIQQTFSLNSQ